ncbi:MAG: hypothetical protein Fur0041_10130 [Bacteroidia bacterium]
MQGQAYHSRMYLCLHMKLLGNIFYRYLWISFNIWLGYFYRYSSRKHATGLHHIPNDRPVIFCSNHPNAFMDAIMVASTPGRRTWFLARSDVFRKKALAKFLSFIGIIPIYRLQEGAENLAKNDETFDKCSKMLEENKAIIIFSEGLCVQERRLRKLKKGTARIAFGSEEKNDFKLNLTIIPVGANYSSTPWKFRSRLYISFGEPIAMKDYEELYRADKARAMNQFTRDLEAKMKEQLVIIQHHENDQLVDRLEEMMLHDLATEEDRDPHNQKETHHVSKEIAHVINEAYERNPEEINVLREEVDLYFEGLKEFGVRDWVMKPATIASMGLADVLKDFVLFFLGFPFWLFGLITNYLPYKLPYIITNKIVKNIEWHASINGTLSVFLWQIFYVLESLAVALIFRDWLILGSFMILMPVCGMIAQEYWVLMKKSGGKSRLIKAFRNNKNAIEELIAMRNTITEKFYRLREEHRLTKE